MGLLSFTIQNRLLLIFSIMVVKNLFPQAFNEIEKFLMNRIASLNYC